MPWVRLDDHFPDHPKVVSAGPLAAWLFVAGICWCNRFLTNGFIPLSQVARLVPWHVDSDMSDSPIRLAERLVLLRLWTETEKKGVSGFLIHDYLKYQASRTQILAARAVSAARQGRFRNGKRHAVSNAVTNVATNGSVTHAPTPTPTPTPTEERKEPEARSKRPIFKGRRLVVFEWQLDDCLKILGKQADDFDLHTWFDALDQDLADSALVLPARDGGRWLQGELQKEVKKRRLPVAGIDEDDDEIPMAWQCRKCGEIHEGTRAQNDQRLCLRA